MLGSGGVIVMDETHLHGARRMEHCALLTRMNPAANAARAAKAATGWRRFFTAIEHGQGEKSDLDLILNISGNIMGNTICPFGDAAAMPAAAFIRKFRDEFEAHIAEKSCTVRGMHE